MLPMNLRRTLSITRWTLAIGTLAGIVLVYHRWVHVNPTTVALTLLLFILVLAAEWGLRYAVVISIAATACYNFYFLPPSGTFTIADPQNWLALFTFLATAIIASRLAERAREEALEATNRQRELEMLFRLSRELLQTDSVASLLASVPSAVASVTNARTGVLFLLDGDRLYQAGEASFSEVEFPHLRQLSISLSEARADSDELQIPIRSGVRAEGVLVLQGASLSVETAQAIGGLISLSIDRARALEGVARGEAVKESDRLRTLMIDSITHELRTPLTSIKGAATTLLESDVAAAERRELLSIIDEESDRLNRLVSEAVEMAQLDAQQVQLHFTSVGVRGLIQDVLQSLSWVQEHHDVRIEAPRDLTIRADANLLAKVIANLIENAAKYSRTETPITITAAGTGEKVVISIADRGIGVDSAEQTLIFERFYRGRSGHSGSAGTGMGLAISRAIAEAHGGEITVVSQAGQGSVFNVILPVKA